MTRDGEHVISQRDTSSRVSQRGEVAALPLRLYYTVLAASPCHAYRSDPTQRRLGGVACLRRWRRWPRGFLKCGPQAHDYKLPRRSRMPTTSHRLRRRRDQPKAFGRHWSRSAKCDTPCSSVQTRGIIMCGMPLVLAHAYPIGKDVALRRRFVEPTPVDATSAIARFFGLD